MDAKRKILVIDDDNLIRMLVRRILELNGYEAVVASTGTEGLNSANTVLPDVILLDVNLPDMDGFAVCAKIRSQATTAQIPVIVMTASDESEYKAQAFANGANDCITKPFDGNDLVVSIRKQLQGPSNAQGKNRH
jgi:two-component system response regulator RpaA